MTDVAPDDNANRDRPAGMAGSQQSLDEADFITDRDLNWLCGYEGGESSTATSHQQRCPELMGSRSYNQLSCHVDATLAEIDMDQFCRADIDKILEISAYSNDLYGEQGLFSNISMDSLDCSSFEADEFLPSLDADESSSGALPNSEDGVLPTSGDGVAVTSSDAGATCSDAAAVTTSDDVALVTSDDATDPATAPSEFRPSPLASPSPAPPLTSWPEQRRSPIQQRTTWPEHRLTPSPPNPVQPASPRTTWQEQCQSPSPPSPSLRETREMKETSGPRETTTWRQQCLPPSPPATPEPEIVVQKRSSGRRMEPVDVGNDRLKEEYFEEANEFEPANEANPVGGKGRVEPPCTDLRRYLLRTDPQQRAVRREAALPETRPTKSPLVERRRPADSSNDRRRELTPTGVRQRGPAQIACSGPRPVASAAAPSPGVDRGCQTTPAASGVCIFPHYTLPGLPFLEHSPIAVPCRHSPTPAAPGSQRVQTSSSSSGSQRAESPAPLGSRRPGSPTLGNPRGPGSPALGGSRATASPVFGNSRGPGSPVSRGAGSPAPGGYPRVNSPGLNGYQRVNSPSPAGYQRVNSPLPAGYPRVNSPIPTGRLTPTATGSPQHRPYSCNDIRTVIRGNMSAIRDWRSLRMLLPQEFQKEMDRLSGGPTSPDSPLGLHVGQCRSASRQGSTGEAEEGADRPSSGEREGGSTQGNTRHVTLTSGSSTGSGKSLNHWFCDAAEFAAANRKELEEFTGSEMTKTKSSDSHKTVSSRGRSDQTGSGKTSTEGRRHHPSVDSGIEMRMPTSFGVHSGSDSSRCESPSHARRVIVVHRDGFEEALNLITESVSAIVAYFQSSAISLSTNEPVGGRLLGDSRRSPAVGYLVLDRLCPALYALLGDGLLTRLDTTFGPVHNSVWRLVESVCPPGICPQPLSDLVLKVNNEEELSESVLKFNAFVFGLLNTQALDWWFGYLVSRQPALLKHYGAEALLRQLSRADSDRLLQQLRRLTRLGFAIELTFESQLLRQSLWRLGRRLLELGGTEKKRATWAGPATGAGPGTGARAGAGAGGVWRGSPARQARVSAAAIRGKLERRWSGRGLDRELLAALTETLSGCVVLDRDENDNSATAEEVGTKGAEETSPKPVRQQLAITEPKTKARGRGRDPARTSTPSQMYHPEQRPKPKMEPHQEQEMGREPKSKPRLHSRQELEPEPEQQQEQEQEQEQEPVATRARARQLEAWWQRVTRDQRSDQLQPWWERQPEQTTASSSAATGTGAGAAGTGSGAGAGAAAAGRSSPPAESRIPRRVAGAAAAAAAAGRVCSTSDRHSAPPKRGLPPSRESRSPHLTVPSAVGTKRKRPVSEGSLRLRLLKRDKEQVNQAREAALVEAARRGSSQPGTRKAGGGQTGSPAPDKRQGKRVRSLVPYHTLNRNFLSYDRNDTLTVVGTTDNQWLLCARDERVGLVTRHHVTNVT